MVDSNVTSWEPAFVQQHLVGVIDLRRGKAVHAVGGNRSVYAPIQSVQGDPIRLARQYIELGIRHLYIADLDAIQLQTVSSQLITMLIEAVPPQTSFMIDLGWRGNETLSTSAFVHATAVKFDHTYWIAAAETATSPKAIRSICELVPPSRVLVGLEYHDNVWMSRRVSESVWLEAADNFNILGAVVLELRTVGSATGPTTVERCRDLKARFPHWKLASGGGIRNQQDANELIDAGCDWSMTATALHSLFQQEA